MEGNTCFTRHGTALVSYLKNSSLTAASIFTGLPDI